MPQLVDSVIRNTAVCLLVIPPPSSLRLVLQQPAGRPTHELEESQGNKDYIYSMHMHRPVTQLIKHEKHALLHITDLQLVYI